MPLTQWTRKKVRGNCQPMAPKRSMFRSRGSCSQKKYGKSMLNQVKKDVEACLSGTKVKGLGTLALVVRLKKWVEECSAEDCGEVAPGQVLRTVKLWAKRRTQFHVKIFLEKKVILAQQSHDGSGTKGGVGRRLGTCQEGSFGY